MVTRTIGGKLHEPFEAMTVDCPEEYVGAVTQLMAARKGRMVEMANHTTGWVRMDFVVPSRGLIGWRTDFLTETRGTGVGHAVFDGYKPWAGEIRARQSLRAHATSVRGRVAELVGLADLLCEDAGVSRPAITQTVIGSPGYPTPPDEMISRPPLETVVPKTAPPETAISSPPFNTIHELAVWPDVMVEIWPLLTITPLGRPLVTVTVRLVVAVVVSVELPLIDASNA